MNYLKKYNQYKTNAAKRKIQFCITYDYFVSRITRPCYLCGIAENNGLDRVDNSKGYINNNVVACCWNCNRAKNNLNLLEFKNWQSRTRKLPESFIVAEAFSTLETNVLSKEFTELSTQFLWDNLFIAAELGKKDGRDLIRLFLTMDFMIKHNLNIYDKNEVANYFYGICSQISEQKILKFPIQTDKNIIKILKLKYGNI